LIDEYGDPIHLRSPWANRAIVYSLAVGGAVLAGFVLPDWIRGAVRGVAEYDVGAAVLLLGYFGFAFHSDERRTRARAAVNDPGRNVALTVTILSVAAGLSGAIAILGRGAVVNTPLERTTAVLLAIAAAIIGWFVTHCTYALRYAHLYYRDDGTPGDGLVFPLTSEPDDYDFLYFSFVIGMTCQVSDVQVTDAGIRRLVLMHGIISFGYNTAILALGINLISNLLH
jgi:uncharacterized membrane protein